jgi:transcriptional regulator with XRE-family HTH domain
MEIDIRLKLAKRLKDLRKRKKITQERLAELSGIDYKHIQLLESRKAPAAKLDTLEKLAKALNISISRLVCFEER